MCNMKVVLDKIKHASNINFSTVTSAGLLLAFGIIVGV